MSDKVFIFRVLGVGLVNTGGWACAFLSCSTNLEQSMDGAGGGWGVVEFGEPWRMLPPGHNLPAEQTEAQREVTCSNHRGSRQQSQVEEKPYREMHI